MTRTWFFLLCGMMPVMAGEMPEKAAGYHEALRKRPESEVLFLRFRDAWLEEKPAGDLEAELLSRAEAGEAGAWGILGRARLAAGKEDEALAAFGKAIEVEPGAVWLRLARAKILLARKDFAAAEKDALAVPEDDKLRPEALKLAGLACLRGERVDEALAHWQKAVASAPGDKGLLEDLTELTRREGRHDLALDFCGKWRDATDDAYGKAMATLKRSELLLAAQRMEEATSELGEVLKASGDGSWLEREALARAEQMHQRQGNATGWAKQITAWADANPVRLNFRRAQAEALAAAGQPAQSLEVLADVLKRVPGDREARWQRISLLERDLKIQEAFDECATLATEEKSEEAGLRVAELAFRLEKKDEVKKALDAVVAAADPAKRVGFAGLYARYGLPAESEKQWRAAAGGESGGQALRELAKHLRLEGRDKEALEVWKEIGRRELAQDRIDAAAALAGGGEREAARKLLDEGREKFSSEPGYEAARAELALTEDRSGEAEAIFRELAGRAQRPDELHAAVKGWLRAAADRGEEATKELGENTGDRCLRAAWLAESEKPLPALVAGDELERSFRLTLLREYRKWPEVVMLLETSGGSGPLYLSELCDAKFSAGDRAGALVAAKAWRERTPDQPGPWLKEADLLVDGGEAMEAETLLRRAVARFESDESVARALFSLLEKNRDMVEALDLAWQRHDQGADAAAKAGWLREIIRVSKGTEGMKDLKERFEEWARRDPASPGPLLALADLARNQGDTYEELTLMTKAAACAPRDVAIVSRLASLEEQMGKRDRALQRYSELARLAPGMESARQLAQAKLRCGDIVGGMRDLLALAGEKGLDIREIEESTISLAVRGYVEESIELLGSLDPGRFDARLHCVLGLLLELDGREAQAFEHFLKVWNEPDDPAERVDRGQGWEPKAFAGIMMLIESGRYEQIQEPGIVQQVQVPGSLAQAKTQLQTRLMRVAMRAGGDTWEKACAAIPALKAGTAEQWREASDFAAEGAGGYGADWWGFVRRFPGNPLGYEMLTETQQFSRATEEQKEALLKQDPPVPLKLALSIRLGREVTPETIAWLEKMEPTTWQDERAFQLGVACAERMLLSIERDEKPDPALAGRLEQMLTMFEKADFRDGKQVRLQLIRTRQALAAGQVEDFLAGVKQLLDTPAAPDDRRSVRDQFESVPLYLTGSLGYPLSSWRRQKGDAAADALIERLPSPVLRCLALQVGNPDACRKRVLMEFAALPADAPRGVRRDLIRLSWRSYGHTMVMREEGRKILRQAAADDSDPRLALEAYAILVTSGGERDGEEAISAADQQRMASLEKRLSASDEADRRYGEWFRQAFLHQGSQTPAATRWGSVGRSGYGSGGGMGPARGQIALIIALKDRPTAVRAAADLLENSARGAMGRLEVLQQQVGEFRKAGLLDEAVAKIQMPDDAGLVRRVSMRVLMDAAGHPEEAREVVAGIQRQRPWETVWLLELALRTGDREECFRLLDEVAARPDFAKIMVARTFERDSTNGLGTAKLVLLADWAERPQANRSWLGQAAVVIGNRIPPSTVPGMKDVEDIYRRYCKLALTDPRCAEVAFGSLYQTTREKEPEVVEDAARQAVLSGAYWTTVDNRPLHGIGRGARGPAPAAIEHLVTMAAKKGDDVVFPREFREKLKAADPALESWLGSLLETKRATDLPGVFTERTTDTSQGSPEWSKHEAAMLRAMHLPGREDLLLKIFKENKQQAVSGNVVHVLRESLAAAAKEKAVEKRLLLFLEANAGPQKGWKTVGHKLAYTSGLIVQAAEQTDSATLVGVVNSLAAWKVEGTQQANVGQSLGGIWRRELGGDNVKMWDGLPGANVRDALCFGYWQSEADGEGNAAQLRFRWAFPQAVQSTQRSDGAIAAQVAGDPQASIIDLMRAAMVSNDSTFEKRLLKLIAPELAKLPAEHQEGVVDELTKNLGKNDMAGLSKLAAERLGKRLEQEKVQRIQLARESFKQMKTAAGRAYGDPDRVCGDLVGKVWSDDPQLLAEIEEYWLALKPAGDAGEYAAGVILNARGGAEVMDRLVYLEKFWKGEPPPPNANGVDPFNAAWDRMDGGASFDPETWDRIAGLSPRMQARVLLAGIRYLRPNRGLAQELSAVAKKSELVSGAHAWGLIWSKLIAGSAASGDGNVLLSYARALKNAGADQDQLAEFLGNAFMHLPRLENAEAVLKETPELLAGIKALPDQAAGTFVNGVTSLWSKQRAEWRRMAAAQPAQPGAKANPPVYPEATAHFIKFVLSKMPAARAKEVTGHGLTAIVLDTGDGELLERWIAIGGPGLAGDTSLILRLLRSGQEKQAVALAPTRNGRNAGFPPYTKEIEQLAKKLDEVDSPQAFRLKASMSLSLDGRGAEAPEEPWEARRDRLATEFGKRAATFPVKDRMDLCLSLGLVRKATLGPVPLLDEFAGDSHARQFVEQMRVQMRGESNDLVGVIHVAAVCSRFHAGDTAGMERLADFFKEALENPKVASEIAQTWLPMIQATFWKHADQRDAVLPEASTRTILKMAGVLAQSSRPEWRGEAATMVRLASGTPEALAATLEKTGLQDVEAGKRFYMNEALDHEAVIRSMLRVAVLHPCAAPELLKNGISQGLAAGAKDGMLDLLADPKVRARLQPADFVNWVQRVRRLSPEAHGFAKTYADERKGDFNDEQREAWQEIQGKLDRAQPVPREFEVAPLPGELLELER